MAIRSGDQSTAMAMIDTRISDPEVRRQHDRGGRRLGVPGSQDARSAHPLALDQERLREP